MNDHIIADILDIARTVYMEAGGEPYAGQLAVAWVIRNRTKGGSVSYQDVIYRDRQFSCWNTTSPTRMNLDNISEESVKAACSAYFGLEADPTAGATIYFNPKVAHPNWDFSKLVKTATIGNHEFYREI